MAVYLPFEQSHATPARFARPPRATRPRPALPAPRVPQLDTIMSDDVQIISTTGVDTVGVMGRDAYAQTAIGLRAAVPDVMWEPQQVWQG